MSYWQHTRYLSKQVFFERLEAMSAAGTQVFDPSTKDWDALVYASIKVSGTWDHDGEILIMNRSLNDQPGVKLITPLKVEGTDKRLMVDRGFVPYEMAQDEGLKTYHSDGIVQIEGLVRPSQVPQFLFATPAVSAADASRKHWLRVDLDELAKGRSYELFPVFIENTKAVAGGPIPFEQVELPASRHLNYTLQWASFGCFALFLGFFFQFKRRKVMAAHKSA